MGTASNATKGFVLFEVKSFHFREDNLFEVVIKRIRLLFEIFIFIMKGF